MKTVSKADEGIWKGIEKWFDWGLVTWSTAAFGIRIKCGRGTIFECKRLDRLNEWNETETGFHFWLIKKNNTIFRATRNHKICENIIHALKRQGTRVEEKNSQKEKNFFLPINLDSLKPALFVNFSVHIEQKIAYGNTKTRNLDDRFGITRWKNFWMNDFETSEV